MPGRTRVRETGIADGPVDFAVDTPGSRSNVEPRGAAGQQLRKRLAGKVDRRVGNAQDTGVAEQVVLDVGVAGKPGPGRRDVECNGDIPARYPDGCDGGGRDDAVIGNRQPLENGGCVARCALPLPVGDAQGEGVHE